MRGPMSWTTDRRRLLVGGAALIVLTPRRALAVARPPREPTAAAIRRFAGEAEIRPGRVHLDLPPLVENGNAVPLAVSVDSPMSATDFVRRIAVFNDKNPQPNVITVHLGPKAGRAALTTRIRLADTQTVTAIAELSDGSYWSATADAIVTLAACVEG